MIQKQSFILGIQCQSKHVQRVLCGISDDEHHITPLRFSSRNVADEFKHNFGSRFIGAGNEESICIVEVGQNEEGPLMSSLDRLIEAIDMDDIDQALPQEGEVIAYWSENGLDYRWGK